MQYLLDTHVILWWLTEPEMLTSNSRKIIENEDNVIVVSSVSFWEMAIKISIGRLTIPNNILELLYRANMTSLPLTAEDSLAVADLERIHNDPFDRMLIIQAKRHDLILVTRDKEILKYPVVTLKA